jgi:hypothetical protein
VLRLIAAQEKTSQKGSVFVQRQSGKQEKRNGI